jgi:hypothetical protein
MGLACRVTCLVVRGGLKQAWHRFSLLRFKALARRPGVRLVFVLVNVRINADETRTKMQHAEPEQAVWRRLRFRSWLERWCCRWRDRIEARCRANPDRIPKGMGTDRSGREAMAVEAWFAALVLSRKPAVVMGER